MVNTLGIQPARIVMLAATAALLLSGCTVAVDDWQESVGDLPVYPGAKALTPPAPATAGVSFTGSFAETTTDGSQFATDDDVDLVLQFYRDAMRSYGRRFECRGAVNVQARGRTEELRCIRSGASDSVQIAASVPGRHSIVRVTPAVNGSTFTLLNVRTRH